MFDGQLAAGLIGHDRTLADMGVRGFGATKAEAFEQAALAMTAVITDLRRQLKEEATRGHS